MQNPPSNHDSPDQELGDNQESNYRSFNLGLEEPFRFVFRQEQILLELQDPINSLFAHQHSPNQYFPKKEENDESGYILFSSNAEGNIISLNQQYELVRSLMDKCRVIQQIILATSKESIYQYGIGFDSDQQKDEQSSIQMIPQSNKIKPSKRNLLKKVSPPIDTNLQFIIQIKNQLQGIFQKYNSDLDEIKNEQDIQFGTREYPIVRSNPNFAILITLPDSDLQSSISLAKQLQIIKMCHLTSISANEKKKFINLFEKLESMKKGLILKITEMKGTEHMCKVCNMHFQNGRKLGGHMSRKHPGNSFQYHIKKQVHSTKVCERNRRNYFKNQKTKRIVKIKEEML